MSAKKSRKKAAKEAEKPTEPPAPEAKGKRPPRAKKEPQPKKLSALNAAAKVLEDAGQPMNCKELIDAMAAKKL